MNRLKLLTLTKYFLMLVCMVTLVACANGSTRSKNNSNTIDLPQKTQSHENKSDSGSYWTEEKIKNSKPVDHIDND